MYETKPYFYGTGRRKNSVARVRVYNGTGKITINAVSYTHLDVYKRQLLYVSTAKYGGDWHSLMHTHAGTELFYVVGGLSLIHI